jgi:hypothetical protein
MHIFAFSALVCLCIHLPDEDLVQVETCMRNVSHKLLFVTDCAVCWIKYCASGSCCKGSNEHLGCIICEELELLASQE